MIDVYTDNGKYRIKDSITNIYNSLNHSVFIFPERGVIVNAHKVKQIDNKNNNVSKTLEYYEGVMSINTKDSSFEVSVSIPIQKSE